MKYRILFMLFSISLIYGSVSGENIKITESKANKSVIKIESENLQKPIKYELNFEKDHRPPRSKDEKWIKNWMDWKYGTLVSFNSNQFSGIEICRTKDISKIDLQSADVSQWISVFKKANMNYAVLTARHTSGFLLWDSPTSDYTVANTNYPKRDLVKEFVDQCRKQGIEPGLYYCLWGGKGCDLNAKKAVPGAREVILAQLYELATKYGDIPYFWIDMKYWGPEDLPASDIYQFLKNINPETVIIFNQHIQDGSSIAYFPTDVVNGEVHLPPVKGHDPNRVQGGEKYYLPLEFELCSQTRKDSTWKTTLYESKYDYCWFTYGEGKDFHPSKPIPAELVAAEIKEAYKRGASNVLLSAAPDHTGKIRKCDKKQLIQIGKLIEEQLK